MYLWDGGGLMISVMKENCGYSYVYWLCCYCIYFYRRSSWFIFQCWTGRSSESGGQTTSSEQKREGCYASGLDAEQIQKIVSTLSTLTHHHAQLMLIWLFYTLLLIHSMLFLWFCFTARGAKIYAINLQNKAVVLSGFIYCIYIHKMTVYTLSK